MTSIHRTGADFFLINPLLLTLTLPGALALAGFDPPFSLLVNITTWMAAFAGTSPLAILYILIRSESPGERLLPAVAGYVILVVVIAYTSYLIQQPSSKGSGHLATSRRFSASLLPLCSPPASPSPSCRQASSPAGEILKISPCSL